MLQTILKTSPKNRNPHPQKTTRNPDLKTAQLGGKTAALATLKTGHFHCPVRF